MKRRYIIPKAIVFSLDEETPLLANSLENLENGTDGDAGSNRRTGFFDSSGSGDELDGIWSIGDQ